MFIWLGCKGKKGPWSKTMYFGSRKSIIESVKKYIYNIYCINFKEKISCQNYNFSLSTAILDKLILGSLLESRSRTIDKSLK